MRSGARAYTIIVQRDGSLGSRTLRIPVWLLRTGVAAGIVLGVLLIAALALYGPVLRAAARVPGLQRDVARLRGENAKIVELSAAVDSLEQRYAQVRRMIGADIVPDALRHTSTLPVAPLVRASTQNPSPRYSSAAMVPQYWPLDDTGFLTRGQVGDTAKGGEVHPGIDIAVPTGSVVRAAAGGSVADAGQDPEYGWFVLLQHAEGYQSMYGHLSRRLVTKGDSVAAGQVIGLSGSTGRSTAPHLHFEIRRQGVSLDPLTMVKEGRQ
jgi:murein DD-endopeptidase MepM/ murein hydrolase activator NlpD